MAAIAINTETNDLALGPGGFYMVTGTEAIRQDLWLRLNTIRGELPYAINVGVPMFEEVTVRGTSVDRVMAIYRKVILTTNGVTGFLIEPIARFAAANSALSFDFKVDTTDGPLSFSSSLPVIV